MEHEKKEDTIEIKIPKINIEKIRRNPWIISTLVFVILSLVLIWNSYSGSSLGNTGVSETVAGENLVKFLKDNAGVQVTVKDISSANGLYKLDVDYQGNPVTLYMTKDGNYLIQSLTPLSSSSGDTGNTGAANVDVFLDNPSLYPSLGPSDAKTTVIEFSDFQCPFCGKPIWRFNRRGTKSPEFGERREIEICLCSYEFPRTGVGVRRRGGILRERAGKVLGNT